MKIRASSFFSCLGCSLLWLAAAFIVGFPEHVFVLDWLGLSNAFVVGYRLESAFIPFLLLVDIAISGWLNHLWAGRSQMMLVVVTAAIYILVTVIAPAFTRASGSVSQSNGNYVLLFIVAFLCLWITRFVTLIPKRFTTFEPFDSSLTSANTGGKV